MTASRKCYQGCLDRARAMGGARNVRWLGGFSFEVTGSAGDLYRVDWQGDNARCTCPAGRNDRVCKHLGCVYLWKLGRQMGAHVEPVLQTPPRRERQQETWL